MSLPTVGFLRPEGPRRAVGFLSAGDEGDLVGVGELNDVACDCREISEQGAAAVDRLDGLARVDETDRRISASTDVRVNIGGATKPSFHHAAELRSLVACQLLVRRSNACARPTQPFVAECAGSSGYGRDWRLDRRDSATRCATSCSLLLTQELRLCRDIPYTAHQAEQSLT